MIPDSAASSNLLSRNAEVENNLLVENQQRLFFQTTSIIIISYCTSTGRILTVVGDRRSD